MASIAIYYRLSKSEITEEVIAYINNLILILEPQHVIKGVFIDQYEESTEFNDLVNSSLSQIDFIYLNKSIEDEFDIQIINSLKRIEHFKVKYF